MQNFLFEKETVESNVNVNIEIIKVENFYDFGGAEYTINPVKNNRKITLVNGKCRISLRRNKNSTQTFLVNVGETICIAENTEIKILEYSKDCKISIIKCKLNNPEYANSKWDYICFTDNDKLIHKKKYGIWEIRPLVFKELDNTKNARWHKIHPHILFKDYDESLWIDANVNISTDYIFNIIKESNKEILIPSHFMRNCIYEECQGCLNAEKESEENINRIISYLKSNNFPKDYGLNETNIIYRKHNSKNITELMEDWWYFVKNYTKRDQLSLSYVLWKHDIRVADISIENARVNNTNFAIVCHKKG